MADMAHLIEPVIPALRRYARTFVRDAADADDLVQDTLERAISRWHQRRSDGETRTWLFTILHNLAVNHLRRAARRGREVPFDDAGESDVESAYSPPTSWRWMPGSPSKEAFRHKAGRTIGYGSSPSRRGPVQHAC